MADFTSGFWDWYIAVITILGIAGCAILLWSQSTTTVKLDADGKPLTTTGHVWDEDLTELNTPMPRWWMWLFYLTIVFAAVYLVLYPGLGSYAGKLGWKSATEYKDELKKADAEYGPLFARFASQDLKAVAADPQARAIGERMFLNYCAQCHGSDARGNKGFPNLTDDDWLHGGSPETIVETITRGRHGMMPPMAAAVGSAQDVDDVANYVLSLSDSPHDAIASERGRAKFIACKGCHGADAKGNTAVGAPNLTDKIWLHGYGKEAIVAMVNNGKTNIMPAQEGRLTTEQIHVVGAYVWSLSHPQAPQGVATR
jgi:cytochrome c oxidase cbb3-type subunit 3